MLDSRTADVSARAADSVSPRAGARMPDGLFARPSGSDDLSFDSVLSDVLSDRITAVRPRRASGTTLRGMSDPAAPLTKVPRKQDRRGSRSQAADRLPGEETQSPARLSTDCQHVVAADTPTLAAAQGGQAPSTADTQPESSPDPAVASAVGQDKDAVAGDAMGQNVALTTGMPSSDVAGRVLPDCGVTGRSDGPADTAQTPDRPVADPEPWQWMATEEAGRANTTTGGPQQARVSMESGPAPEVAFQLMVDAVPASDRQVGVPPSADAVTATGIPTDATSAQPGDGAAANDRGSAGPESVPSAVRTDPELVSVEAQNADPSLDGQEADQNGTPAESGDDRRPGQGGLADLPRTGHRASTQSSLTLPQQQAGTPLPDTPSRASMGDRPTGGPSVTAESAEWLHRPDPSAVGVPAAGHSPRIVSPTASQVVNTVTSDAAAHVATLVRPEDAAGGNMNRLAAVVYAAVGRQQSVARMQLEPPELGAVTAVVQMRRSRMELKLEVASESARDLITGGLDRLRDILQQQGIWLDRAAVNVASRGEHASTGQQHLAGSGNQDQAWDQFNSHHGHQQEERSFGAWPAVDVATETAVGSGDSAVAGVSYGAGLNVLA